MIVDTTVYDRDGVLNDVDACATFSQSGTDEDADGIDDACDGEIRDIPLDDPLPELPPQNPLSFDSDDAEDEGYANSLLKPYVLPQVKPTEENSSSQTKTDSNTPPTSSTLPPTGSRTASQLTTVAGLSGSIAPYYGYALYGQDEPSQTEEKAPSSAAEVLGTTTLRAPRSTRQEGSSDRKLAYIVAGAIGTFIVIQVLRKRAHHRDS